MLLGACGTLPQPFLGDPGPTARRLGEPPEPRLIVAAPETAGLPPDAARRFADLLARDLRAAEVPAYAVAPAPTDWRLDIAAADRAGQVTPRYTVRDPTGKPQGNLDGPPVAAGAWTAGAPAALEAAAGSAAPRLAQLLDGVEVGLMRADPTSLYNRPARVRVVAVTGAPGNGDATLTRAMRAALRKAGETVQPGAQGADFTVRGQVRITAAPHDQQRVELRWIVATAAGKEGGRVFQLNLVPAGTLDHDWGQVAPDIAGQAAGGIRQVILRQSRLVCAPGCPRDRDAAARETRAPL
ncbi:MAG: hypothetical protein KGI51_14350 [Rhodospirillales bacterium]|nr:hypothetical protein [Rhodospirillales bacterium]